MVNVVLHPYSIYDKEVIFEIDGITVKVDKDDVDARTCQRVIKLLTRLPRLVEIETKYKQQT